MERSELYVLLAGGLGALMTLGAMRLCFRPDREYRRQAAERFRAIVFPPMAISYEEFEALPEHTADLPEPHECLLWRTNDAPPGFLPRWLIGQWVPGGLDPLQYRLVWYEADVYAAPLSAPSPRPNSKCAGVSPPSRTGAPQHTVH